MSKERITQAPGKVILFGEHGVSYGTGVIAATIDKKTILKYIPDESGYVTVKLSTLGFESSVKIGKVPSDSKTKLDSSDPNTELALKVFFTLWNEIQVQAAGTFVYSTDIPIGAGLGSSAAFCTVTAKMFLELKGKADFDTVNRFSHLAENIVHGKASGIDNYTCLKGGFVFYSKSFFPLVAAPLRCVLVDTRKKRRTADCVRIVSEFKDTQPEKFSMLLSEMKAVVEKAKDLLERNSSLKVNSSESERHLDFMQLVDENQRILKELRVSSEEIDQICDIAHSHACSGKLTGAGKGGHVIIFGNPENFYAVVQELNLFSFDAWITTLGA